MKMVKKKKKKATINILENRFLLPQPTASGTSFSKVYDGDADNLILDVVLQKCAGHRVYDLEVPVTIQQHTLVDYYDKRNFDQPISCKESSERFKYNLILLKFNEDPVGFDWLMARECI